MSKQPAPLLAAVQKKNKADFKKAIEKGDQLDDVDGDQRTALHLAVRDNQPDFVKLILKLKVKVDSCDRVGFTPLLSAAEAANLKILEILLKAKANPNALTSTNDTVLHLLLTNPKWSKDCIGAIKQLLQEFGFAEVNRANKTGLTPLYAAAQRSPEVVQLLLKHKADPNLPHSGKNEVPIFAAVAEGHGEAVRMLLEAGTSIHLRNGTGQSIVDAAKSNENLTKIIKRFMATVPGGDRQIRQVAEETLVVATKAEELPAEVREMLATAELPLPQVNAHWELFCNIVQFVQKRRIFATEAEAQHHREKTKAAQMSSSQPSGSSSSTPVSSATGSIGAPRDDEKKQHHHHHHKEHKDSDVIAAYHTWEREHLVPEKLLMQGNPKDIFKKLQSVGKGGFGMVFSTIDPRDKSKVAIKRMPHQTERDQRMNLREVYFLTNCRHPNVVQLRVAYDSPVDHELWLIMELLEGGTLDEAVEEEHSFFVEKHVAYATKAVLSALQFLHLQHVAHRDLKAANIMLSVRGEVKLIDFGLAIDMSPGPRTEMVGSPFWMPPEMIAKKPHSYPADIWSMAICVLEMANKAPPNSDSVLRSMFRTVCPDYPVPALSRPQNWSPEFQHFLSLCLVRDSAGRSSADELLKHSFLSKACKQTDMECLLRQIFMGNQLKENGFF